MQGCCCVFLTLKIVKHAQVAQCVLQQYLFGWVKIPVLDDVASDCSDNLQLQQWTGIRCTMLSDAPQRADSQSEYAAQEIVCACLRSRYLLLKLVHLGKHRVEELHTCCYTEAAQL